MATGGCSRLSHLLTARGDFIENCCESRVSVSRLCCCQSAQEIVCYLLSYLGLPRGTKVPPGNKGKAKLKKLYRMAAPNGAYHSGKRAESLIACLDMARIRALAPIPLEEIDEAIKTI